MKTPERLTRADLDNLRRDGLLLLEPVDWAESYIAYMQDQPVYPGHVKVYGDKVARPRQTMEVCSHDMSAVLKAPHFFSYALSLTDFVSAYLDEPTLMYSVNAFWTKPGHEPPAPAIQKWHRDGDDRKFIALFMYGSHIREEEDGPHLFVLRSQNDPVIAGAQYTGSGVAVYGPPGTMFLADTRAWHMGIKPLRGERLITWCRWGVSDPPNSYVTDQLAPVPRAEVPAYPHNDARLQGFVRLVTA